MAGGWSIPENLTNPVMYGDMTGSAGTAVTTGAVNTKGSWVALSTSTSADISWLMFTINFTSIGGSQTYGWDLSNGSAGNEATGIFLQNLVAPSTGNSTTLLFPTNIVAGSRLSVRAASSVSTDSIQCNCIGFDSAFMTLSTCGVWDTYGWSGTGAIQGTAVDPGGTANTKGSWVTLSASTTNDYLGFMMGVDPQNYSSVASANGSTLFDIGIGAGPTVIVPNIPVAYTYYNGGINYGYSFTPFLQVNIPSGSAVKVRSQCSDNTATARVRGVSFYGLRA